MTINIMNQYIELTKKEINAYMKLVFGKKFNKNYVDEYTKKYINLRYLDFNQNNIEDTARKRIMEQLKKTMEDLIIYNIQDRDLIEKMSMFFYYMLYFDNVVYYTNLDDKIEKIERLRKKTLNKETKDFKQKLYEIVNGTDNAKKELLDKFKSDTFYIKISNYPENINTYKVTLKFNIEFPMEYSNWAIEKAFDSGIINEDKLIIEYYLTTTQIIKDLVNQNFKKQYIVEFTTTILKKQKKCKSLLNIISNSAIQDKLNLKIKYKEFLENKEQIYNLMRDGYRFAIVLDNSFEMNIQNIEKLSMFNFIIVSKNLENYEELMKYEDKIKNMIKVL